MKLAVFFVGELNDDGFNSSALAGVEVARQQFGVDIQVISDVRYDQEDIRDRLRQVTALVDGVIFIGGQGDIAMPAIALDNLSKKFAVIQGQQVGSNLAAYDVMQEESAFLAGCLAAKLTRSGIVSHLSGHRVRPGLKGRAAFFGGVKHTAPSVEVLTGFCGTQDDNNVTRIWAGDMFAAGADILFTMLNGARQGAIDACREHDVLQIGNALDWCARDPKIFVGSALARIDQGVVTAVEDMLAGRTPGAVVHFGLGDGDYVSLATNSSVPQHIRDEIAHTADQIRAGSVVVPTDYQGPEYVLAEASCSNSA